MSKEIRTVTYRLYPSKAQEMMMDHFLDCTRKAYNRLVEICRTYVEKHLSFPSEMDLMKMATKIRQRHKEMQDVHSHCFASVAKRVHNAFTAWMKRHDDGVGFPRFRSWKMFDSFTYTWKTDYGFVGKNGEKHLRERIRLGMIGLLKFSNPYIINGECKTATVFRRRFGDHFEWYVAIAFGNDCYRKDVMSIDPVGKREDVGMDLGLENLAVLSDGSIIPNDRTYRKKEDDLTKQQRKLSLCEKGTPGYQKQLTKLSHKFKKLRDHRKDLFHKISRELTENYRDIVMEDISVKEMSERSNKGMRKSYRDAGWGIFTGMIRYKAAEAGNRIIFVDPAYTSQLCSSCGTMVPKDLSVREHICPHCGLIMSRDRNAAINILNRGLGLQTEAGIRLKCHEGWTIPSAGLEFSGFRPKTPRATSTERTRGWSFRR
ncbi:MAG: transposase [Candidatus Methanomethylophilaceae archaeon]|nr:transposase [Candidatus Methanomethylophilaceae archaeon]